MKPLEFLSKKILTYFRASKRDLPWRQEGLSAYAVWVSEIMLQQTQVSRVIPYFEKFMKRFPNVESLAKATWEEFLPYYAGLGYYRRGRNMLACAKIVASKYDGEFPRDVRELEKLPGVGKYTARAILSFGYSENALAFDTNMQRVFGRYLKGSKFAEVDPEEISKGVTKNKRALNAAIMDFGNDICTTKPKCEICPLRSRCLYPKTSGQLEKISKKEKVVFPSKKAQVFLWLHRDHKEYYSQNPDDFEVFVLPSSCNSREAIKKYFEEKYELNLAVRPPHKKTFVEGVPTMFVNAQILLGDHEFGIFKKGDIEDYFKRSN